MHIQTIMGPDPDMAVGGLAALSRCVIEGDDEFHKVRCSTDATDRLNCPYQLLVSELQAWLLISGGVLQLFDSDKWAVRLSQLCAFCPNGVPSLLQQRCLHHQSHPLKECLL